MINNEFAVANYVNKPVEASSHENRFAGERTIFVSFFPMQLSYACMEVSSFRARPVNAQTESVALWSLFVLANFSCEIQNNEILLY